MKFYHVPIPDDDQQFFRAFAEVMWFEERMINMLAAAVNLGLWGKKR
jgi:hypothetical protein